MSEALSPAAQRVQELLRAAGSEARVRQLPVTAATAADAAAPLGCTPAPRAHATPPRIFIDQDLRQHAAIWAAAGHPHAVFPLTAAELERLTGGAVIEVK